VNPYDIQLEPEAEDQLAAIWTAAGGRRDAITRAQDTADRRLAADPFRYGRHLSEGLYRLDVPPLVIYYTVLTDARVVKVTEVYDRPS
jgi:mRNA-degrading endonuclease RelE of RelBE toxin-antitoxin system